MPRTYCAVPIDTLYAAHIDTLVMWARDDGDAFNQAVDHLGSSTPFLLREGERFVVVNRPTPAAWMAAQTETPAA